MLNLFDSQNLDEGELKRLRKLVNQKIRERNND